MKKEYHFIKNYEYTYKCSVTIINHNGELIEHFVLSGYHNEITSELSKFGEISFNRSTNYTQIITEKNIVMINFNII